jgi:hypothetical protein
MRKSRTIIARQHSPRIILQLWIIRPRSKRDRGRYEWHGNSSRLADNFLSRSASAFTTIYSRRPQADYFSANGEEVDWLP